MGAKYVGVKPPNAMNTQAIAAQRKKFGCDRSEILGCAANSANRLSRFDDAAYYRQRIAATNHVAEGDQFVVEAKSFARATTTGQPFNMAYRSLPRFQVG